MNDRRVKRHMHAHIHTHTSACMCTCTHKPATSLLKWRQNISPQTTTKSRYCINQSDLPTTIKLSVVTRTDASYYLYCSTEGLLHLQPFSNKAFNNSGNFKHRFISKVHKQDQYCSIRQSSKINNHSHQRTQNLIVTVYGYHLQIINKTFFVIYID